MAVRVVIERAKQVVGGADIATVVVDVMPLSLVGQKPACRLGDNEGVRPQRHLGAPNAPRSTLDVGIRVGAEVAIHARARMVLGHFWDRPVPILKVVLSAVLRKLHLLQIRIIPCAEWLGSKVPLRIRRVDKCARRHKCRQEALSGKGPKHSGPQSPASIHPVSCLHQHGRDVVTLNGTLDSCLVAGKGHLQEADVVVVVVHCLLGER
mmetsp:Transcript_28761/g.67021  ORF Transcript_28761/g.67021 Transcript_28761/m.67021 type:complete len:208 (+) Transcript_28761:491-1114(+)